MLRFLRRYETSLAEITVLLEHGWEVYDSDECGFWLSVER